MISRYDPSERMSHHMRNMMYRNSIILLPLVEDNRDFYL